MKIKKILSSLLAATMLFGSVTANAVTVESKDVPERSGAAVEVESSGDGEVIDYGLADNIEDGVILHAWSWNVNTIGAKMEMIAQAGYTAVQTSPVAMCYDKYANLDLMGTKISDSVTNGAWWWNYQPTALRVGNYALFNDPDTEYDYYGTNCTLSYEQQYKKMCEQADRYGIKIISDIVINHTTAHYKLNGSTEDSSLGFDLEDEYYLHTLGSEWNVGENWKNLYHTNYKVRREDQSSPQRIHYIDYMNGDLPDINTENEWYQAYLVEYMNKLIELGCDGFRFDMALNVGLEEIDGSGYTFWKAVTGKTTVNNYLNQPVKLGVLDNNTTVDPNSLYYYGEILKFHNEYDQFYKKYIRVTDNTYSDAVRNAVKTGSSGTIKPSVTTDNRSFILDGQSVVWVESHDNYCGDSHSTCDLNDDQIKLTWAILTAYGSGTPLFFNRPAGSTTALAQNGQYWGSNKLGAMGNDQFRDSMVVAVNKFHNAMAGQNAVARKISDPVLQIDRGNIGSCIINNSNSQISLNTKETSLSDGTYYDKITGQKITVSNGKFTSGTVSSKNIAVIYNSDKIGVTTDQRSFTADTLTVTTKLKNASNGNYTVSVDGNQIDSGFFSDGSNIVLGSGVDVGSTSKEILLTLTATDSENSQSIVQKIKFVKRNESDVTYVYFDPAAKPAWCSVFAYIYSSTSSNEAWPGKPMTYDETLGLYKYEIPYDLKDANVIFNKGTGGDGNQVPASDGYALEGKSKLYNSSSSFVDYVVTIPEDLVTFEDADQDLQTNSYVYFFNYNNWNADSIKVTLSDGSNNIKGLMKYSNDLHCYYYKYNSTVGYTKVTFTDNSNTSNTSGEIDLMPGKVYVPNGDSIEWISPDDIKERKVFFKKRETTPNSTNNWNSVYAYCYRGTSGNEIANAAWPGIQTVNIDNSYYAYTYYTPRDLDIYSKVVFNAGAGVYQQTPDLDAPTTSVSKTYMTNNGTKMGSGTSSSPYVYPCSEESISDSTVNITLHYYDYKLAQINNSDIRTAYSVTNNNVAVTSGNISNAITTCVQNFSMQNQYDTYVFHTSQFDYVKAIATTEDTNLIQGSNHSYAARINPMYFAYQTKDYRGFYPGIADLNTLYSSNNKAKWVTYKDSSGAEILPESVRPDFANVASIDLYAYSMPKSYTVTFYYPTQNNPTISQIGETGLYAANYNNTHLSSGAVKFNELVKSRKAKIITPEGYTFDGWYKIDGTNYLKVSSSMTYSCRATESAELFAVYKTNAEYDPQSGCTVTAKNTDGADVYANGSGNVMYRMNTVLNVYDCSNPVSDVAVVYVRLHGTTNSSTINTYLNSRTDGNNTIIGMRNTISDTLSGNGTEGNFSVGYNSTTCDASYHKYTNGTNAQLTNKNRLQFIQSVSKEKILGTYDESYENDYSNVLVFTAFKTGNEWKISDNCVYYSCGSPTTILLSGV